MGIPFEEDNKRIDSVKKTESSSDSNGKMNPGKKERRKPNVQLYRPGMGLQNKSTKIEDCHIKNENISPDEVKLDLSVSSNVNVSSNDNSIEMKSELQKPKKIRNRRPTAEVYVPKAKVAAQLNEKKIESSKSNSSEVRKNGVEHPRKRHTSSSTRITHQDARPKSVEKEYEKESYSTSKCSNSSSPLPTSSWANLMEESDLSNSRSTPEAELCSDNPDSRSSVSKSRGQRKENRSGEPKRSRSRRNSLRQETFVSNQKGSMNSKPRSSEGLRNANIEDESNQHEKTERGKRFSRSRNFSEKSGANSSRRADNVHERTKEEIHNHDVVERSHVNHQSRDSNSTLDNKMNLDRKKKEKSEPCIPPRFQRNKTATSDTNHSASGSGFSITSQNGSGGILKLPAEFQMPDSHADVLENTMYPTVFKEPQTFIHKQLFDPNNPSKPEIINIPAPVPHSVMPYSKLSPPYYSTDNFSPPFISAPVPNLGYIPPPQPATAIQQPSHQYFYTDCSVPTLYQAPRDGIGGPIQCPSPVAPLDVAFSRSLCFNEVPVVPEPGKRRLKPIVEKNLHEIVLLEKELYSILDKGFNFSNINSNAFKQCRWKLQLRYENIILADPKYCAEKNPEQSLWKSAFHQVIEMLRKEIEENPEDEEKLKECLLNIILEGSVFYENLLEKQQETYGFKLVKVLELEIISSALLPDHLRCVLISVQKVLIFLGDLARYKEQACQTVNYGKARSWYLKAQQIAPKNGRPYNQLAILAMNTRRKLDAVYYYMRSLAASNPFLSAKESLLNLFEDSKRKYEFYEAKRSKEVVEEIDTFEDNTNERCEVWIKPDGSHAQRPTDKNIDPSDLKNLSDVELNKRFVISFLHVHGKLFTKIGMETFPDALRQMLKEFYFLLQRNPLPLTSTRILQLVAVNIFSVTNSSLKENGREQGGSSMLQEQAIYTSNIMMSLLMDRCHMLHIAHKSSPEYPNQMISDGLAHLLPAVKIWTDWMSCQKYLWAPVPSALLEKLNVGFDKDVWTSFAELLTVLREIDISDPVIVSNRTNDTETIILDEDCTFAGYVPLLGAIHKSAYAVRPFDKDKAKHCLRISRIQFFGDYLCGISPPYMEFDVESKKFVSLVTRISMEESFERSALLSSTDESYRENSFVEDPIDDCSSSVERDEIQMLKSRKEALSKAVEEQEKQEAQIQAVLFKHQSQRRTVLKIKPRYLVPDTNCFIDNLPFFSNILSSTDFHLIVPLVVINELDGLARGNRVNGRSTPEHASRVTALSRDAINFLEKQFASRHPHLRAITSQGSILDTISFRSEEMGQNKGTNDDLILTCCLKYCKDRAELFMPKNRDDPITLFREVVLLTDDRNLRVKALAHHVPVRDMLSFLQWANS